MEPPIYVTHYTNKTLAESQASGERKMFSRNVVKCVPDGAILVGINTDTKSIVRVAVADGTFGPRSLLDPDVFAGEDVKYQKSELKLKSCRDIDIPLAMVGAFCGIPPNDKTRTNVTKCAAIEYAKVFYKGDDAAEILRKYRILITALV
jgi:hypothetical protein